MTGSNIIVLSEKNFSEEVLQSSVPVLVDFWATWCGPCRMIAPVMEELAADYAEKARVCKLDVDENGPLAAQYGVMSIPTLLLFKDGKEVNRFVGVQPKTVFSDALDSLI